MVAGCRARDAGGAHAPPAQSPHPTVRASLPPPSYPATSPSHHHHVLRPPANACHSRIAISQPRTARAIRHWTRGAGCPGAVSWWRSGSVSAAGWGRLGWVWRPPATSRTHRTAAQGHPAPPDTRRIRPDPAATMLSRAGCIRPCRSPGYGGRHIPRRCTAPHTGLSHPPSRWLKNMPVGRVSARGRRRAMVEARSGQAPPALARARPTRTTSRSEPTTPPACLSQRPCSTPPGPRPTDRHCRSYR